MLGNVYFSEDPDPGVYRKTLKNSRGDHNKNNNNTCFPCGGPKTKTDPHPSCI